ncbi:endonuclease/exonuclease/phosphatase family protein [Sphaerisporangium sp. NPDC051011]|uniref:endonuclease/exonuclease/phosphatase family protein n=1 Tax=Sphaerisporangium sp. NPDC051011 TaxID=3155792 RepID=UPI0033EA8AE3
MVVVGTWNLENLYRPGGEFGPRDETAYKAKIKALAATINGFAPDVLGVQEVGHPAALTDLTDAIGGEWHVALSRHPDARGIRVGVISRLPLTVAREVSAFTAPLAAVQHDDAGPGTDQTSRGMLAVQVEPTPGTTLDVAVCHLKSKLLSFPGGRFAARDEGERARYGAYALYRRAAEATTLRGLADSLVAGHGQERAVVVVGDFNDEPQAATTQIVLGPPGSELGTPGALRPDKGDAYRLWNLATRIMPENERYSRVHNGKGELIDHILVSRALIERVDGMRSVVGHGLPSVTEDPKVRRDAADSDHAPLFARLRL